MGFLKDLKEAGKRGREEGKRQLEKEEAEFLKRLQEAPDYKLEITVKGLESKLTEDK